VQAWYSPSIDESCQDFNEASHKSRIIVARWKIFAVLLYVPPVKVLLVYTLGGSGISKMRGALHVKTNAYLLLVFKAL